MTEDQIKSAVEHYETLLRKQLARVDEMEKGASPVDLANKEKLVIGVIGGDGIGSGIALVGQALTDTPSVWMFFIGGVFASFSFKFWYKGASMCGAALVMGCNGTYAFWGPAWCLVVCGLIFGVDGYAIPWQGWVGAVIMVIGIVILAISQDKASKEA